MKHALLAEDDPVNRLFLTEALNQLGWQVTAFESGKAAAEAAIAQAFDVLLLDLNLPGCDGVTALRQIRNHDSHASADAPALALTADHRAELHARLQHQGFDAVATKPLSIEQLSKALSKLGLAEKPASPSPQTPSHDNDSPPPIWDDAPALAAVAGNHATLKALRQLLLNDLPPQRDRILANPHSPQARTDLHRLRAACGFCGASALLHAVIALENTPPGPATTAALEHFAQKVEQILAAGWD